MNKVELMAPAGSLEILKAAVDSGADAVYLGVGAYNARMNAENFTFDDLAEGVKYAHYRSSKVYLTLNTLVNDYEFDDAVSSARSAYDLGVDGLIIQDIGLFEKIHEKLPDMYLIGSTQMNIYSYDAMSNLSKLGFSRVVLPRELSVNEIKRRTKAANANNLQTEVFVHGAVCVSCSGLCLFSSMNKSGSRSGNRGLCAQPCRQEYDLYAEKTKIKSGHLLSPKDRSSVPYIAELIESGVSSFKIEGRMREVGYVVNTVRAYRKLIDAYYDGTLDSELERSVQNDLLVSFNRGGSFTSQYLNEKKDQAFLSGEYVGKYGLKLGNLKSKDPKKGSITFSFDEDLPLPDKGDYLSVRKGSIELCSFPIGKIHEAPGSLTVKGLHPEVIERLPDGKVQVFLMGHDVQIKKDELKKTHVDLSLNVEGDLLSIDAKVNHGMNRDVSSYYDVDIPSDFDGNPIDSERIESQLKKTGDTPFVVDNVYIVTNEPIKCRISLLNELRRGALEGLLREIDYKYERDIMMEEYDMFSSDSEDSDIKEGKDLILHVFPSFKRISGGFNRDADLYGFSFYDLLVNGFANKIYDFIAQSGSKLVIMMPDFCHDSVMKLASGVFERAKKELGDSLYGYVDSNVFGDNELGKTYGIKHFLSAGTNGFNSKSMNILLVDSDGAFISYETEPTESYEMLKKVSRDKVLLVHTDGLIPWMQSHFCPVGAHKDGCRSCYDQVTYRLKGDGDKECIVISRPADCSSVIYGPSKFSFGEENVQTLNDMGFDTISVRVEI
ncbi:MAG: U32 family peptidase [Clostridiales bacterium]|nr:U32 family peptidase [Clostridiales bacterium]